MWSPELKELGKLLETGKGKENGLFPRVSRRQQTCQHLDFRTSDSQNCKRINTAVFVVIS